MTSAPAVAANATISSPSPQVSRNKAAEEEDEEGMRVLQDRIEMIGAEKREVAENTRVGAIGGRNETCYLGESEAERWRTVWKWEWLR
jgi:hypothetical protein